MKRKNMHHVANVRVEGSNPFARSNFPSFRVKPCKISNVSPAELDRYTREAARLGKATYLWDRGLGLRVAPTGTITYQVHLGGRRKSHPSLQEALQDWDQKYRARRPSEGSQATTLATPSQNPLYGQIWGPSVDVFALWSAYLEERGRDTRFWRDLDKRFTKHVLPKIGDGRKGDIIHLLDSQGGPVAKRTLYEALGPFYKWLLYKDVITTNPMSSILPPRLAESRDRILSVSEVRELWRRTEAEPYWGPFFRLLLLTGQRRSEVAGMQWKELDLVAKVWTIPKERTKNGRAHKVPLSPQAMMIINSRPPFIGQNPSGFSKAKARVGGEWRIHDLRRTVATGLEELGVDPVVIEAVLNHSKKGVRAVYHRFQYEIKKREALDKWGAHTHSYL